MSVANTAAVIRAEWLKLRTRPVVLILLVAMGAIVVVFGYLLLYVAALQTPGGGAVVTEAISLANMPGHTLIIVATVASAVGLVLGVLAVGSEYGWRTFKTSTTQRPRRHEILVGQMVVLFGICVALAAVAFVAGAIGAAGLSLAASVAVAPPAPADLAAAFGVVVLILAVWCGVGACLAVLLRGTGAALGAGAFYAFVGESVLALLPLQGAAGDALAGALISNNTRALIARLAPENALGAGGAALSGDIAPLQAVVVLVLYLGVAATVAGAVFARRDLT